MVCLAFRQPVCHLVSTQPLYICRLCVWQCQYVISCLAENPFHFNPWHSAEGKKKQKRNTVGTQKHTIHQIEEKYLQYVIEECNNTACLQRCFYIYYTITINWSCTVRHTKPHKCQAIYQIQYHQKAKTAFSLQMKCPRLLSRQLLTLSLFFFLTKVPLDSTLIWRYYGKS